ncbi:UNVERIFIED_CONTAM: hypothetical protein Slati_0391100 [Sesamum latifolium]|uniref:Reverse transcriptase domain-containing protein n=1 Tax=Sesamum latifolium TaxID=2727402 RepID=A0AAW2XU16_9LAMI
MIRAAAWNVRGLNCVGHQGAVRSNVLTNWSWFEDYSILGGRIWLAWNPLEIDVEIVRVEVQFIHWLCSLSEDISVDPWCVLGDFNAIIDGSEVCGRSVESSHSMTEFRDCICATGLVHLPFTGCPFTWHNCSEGSRSLWKRLDRVLVNEAWLVSWPQASYMSALPSTSDHSPLILKGAEGRLEQGLFRFDNFLAKQPGFLNTVRDWWRHSIHGTKMYGVVCKLKALKPIFRAQRKAKGDLAANVEQAKAFLDIAQHCLRKEDILMQLVQWCRLIYCAAVKMEGAHITEAAQIADEFVSYYQPLLGGVRVRRDIDLSFLQPGLRHRLNNDEAADLIAPVSATEIKDAFFDISEDSALGPDGYTSAFYKLLGLKLVVTYVVLFWNSFSPGNCSSNSIQRCWMQRILNKLIDQSQTAFIPGRSISDNVLLGQELLAGYNRARLPPRCTIKIDFQKAYDSICWDFLLEGLRNAGYSAGGPNVPLLICYCDGVMACFVENQSTECSRFYLSLEVSRGGAFNLCFADDVLVFCSGNPQLVRVIQCALAEFAELSGLRANPSKSRIILSKAVREE